MIRGITIRNFKVFQEQKFDLADSIILAGPNNAGKSTLLQSIAMWKLALQRWIAQREGSHAVRRSGVAIPRTDITAVPLRHTNLLWEGRRVSGPQGISGTPRLIEIIVEGLTDGEEWVCGMELQYANPELVYARPSGAKDMDSADIRCFPPEGAKSLDIIHVPPLSGIERDEPRRDRGMQDLLVGLGRPGEVLRNLLLEIHESGHSESWDKLTTHVQDLFGIKLLEPAYAPTRPYIVCEYREPNHRRPLDLANAGNGTLQVLLLLAFLHARPATVILLDEPDAHQHVMLQRQVHDLIRKTARDQGGQVIIATHSEVILDATEPKRVLGFLGQTPRALATETERDGIREALKRITTTELLLGQDAGGVLYIEGESDERILKEWARILEHPAHNFFKRPFVHWLGGRSIREAKAHFFAMRAAIPDIRGLCLIDGDNRDEPDEETTNAGLIVLRWRRNEIENYLLQPDSIARFVDFPLLESQVREAFWRQVPQETDLFGDHVALTRIKASEEFLIPLLQEAGLEISKRDLHLLAATMQNLEIHPEVAEKLDRIADSLLPQYGHPRSPHPVLGKEH